MARNGRNRRNSGVWVTFCTVFKPCIFIGFRRFEEPQNYSLRNHRENSRRAVSLTKIIHPITFWLRFFFLWLRFFLFGRSKKKEMNKTTPYATGYFASLNMTPPASCHPEHSEGSKTFLHKDISLTLNMTPPSPRKLFVFEAAPKRNKQSPRRGSPQRPHPQGVRIYTAYACICGKNLLRLLSP